MGERTGLAVLLTGIMAIGLGCHGQTAEEEKPVAKVNDYVITEKAFRRELSSSARLSGIVAPGWEDKKGFLDEQIKKELLIQIAVARGLDKEEGFRESIENYWQQTLITALLKEQCSRLEKDIVVSREEIEARYRQMADSGPGLSPLCEMLPGIERQIREEKKTEALEKWVTGLAKEAKVHVFEENLRALR